MCHPNSRRQADRLRESGQNNTEIGDSLLYLTTFRWNLTSEETLINV
jgi:hypothetical protein